MQNRIHILLHIKQKETMGEGLSRPSLCELPCPGSLDAAEVFTKIGIRFEPPLEAPLARNRMVPVKLPEGWGFWIEHDRRDMLSVVLTDVKGQSVADIQWMSKGAYDNECSMTLLKPKNQRQLDLEKVTRGKDGFYRHTADISVENMYREKLNCYHENQFRGASQEQLDIQFTNLQIFEQTNNIQEHSKLVKLSVEKPGAGGALQTIILQWADPYPLLQPNVWKELN